MTDIGIRDISVSFHDNKISNISLVQGDALTRGFDITFVNAKGETLPVDDDYIVELVAVNSKNKDTPYACRHEIVDDKYRVMIPPEALSESGSVTIQLVFYQKSTKAVIHTIKQKCPVYQSIGQEFVESNNLYVDITALRLGLEKIEKLDGKYEEIIEKDIEIQANETERKEAENKRNLDEVIRKDNEAIRNSNEEKREQLKTALIELKNSIESDLGSINLAVDDIISSEDDRKQNEIVREEIKVELENLVADIQNKLDNGDFVGEKGEQGIQGEQGPQGPPGEVTQEEFDNLSQEVTAHKEDYAQLNGEERITALEESKIKKYGVKFLGSNPVGERLYDAVGMVANVAVDDEIVVNDFDDVSFFDRPICNVYFDINGNPQVMAYRGEPGFSFEGGIFPPYAEKSDVYYECSPCGWNGSFDSPVVTGTPMEGFELFDCFPDWNTKIYLPSYFMGMEDGRPTSRSGVKPGYYSINTAFTTAQAWNTNAHGETITTHMYEYILQCIEFATRDLQTVMYGVGTLTYDSATDLALVTETGVNRIILARADNYVIGQTIVIGTARNSDNVTGERIVTSIEPYNENGQALHFDGEPANIEIGNFVSSRAYKNGATDIVVASSGSPVDNTSGKYPCIWRGKADPWGNGYSGISDLLTKRYGVGTPEDPYTYKLCYLKDPKKYANGVITSDYIELSYNLPAGDGYVKELGQDTRFPLIGFTKEIGAASTTYYADYYYYPRYNIGAVFVGGYFYRRRGGGPLFFDCLNIPSSVHISRLARLFVTPF